MISRKRQAERLPYSVEALALDEATCGLEERIAPCRNRPHTFAARL